MGITQAYREQFAAVLAAAKFDKVDSRVTPEEFPNESFEDLSRGLRIMQPSARWFNRKDAWMPAKRIDKWFAASQEATRFGAMPGTLAHGLYLCANHDLHFEFNLWHTLIAPGSRSVTNSLMPTFRRRTDGRVLELLVSYDRNEPISPDFAIIVYRRPRG